MVTIVNKSHRPSDFLLTVILAVTGAVYSAAKTASAQTRYTAMQQEKIFETDQSPGDRADALVQLGKLAQQGDKRVLPYLLENFPKEIAKSFDPERFDIIDTYVKVLVGAAAQDPSGVKKAFDAAIRATSDVLAVDQKPAMIIVDPKTGARRPIMSRPTVNAAYLKGRLDVLQHGESAVSALPAALVPTPSNAKPSAATGTSVPAQTKEGLKQQIRNGNDQDRYDAAKQFPEIGRKGDIPFLFEMLKKEIDRGVPPTPPQADDAFGRIAFAAMFLGNEPGPNPLDTKIEFGKVSDQIQNKLAASKPAEKAAWTIRLQTINKAMQGIQNGTVALSQPSTTLQIHVAPVPPAPVQRVAPAAPQRQVAPQNYPVNDLPTNQLIDQYNNNLRPNVRGSAALELAGRLDPAQFLPALQNRLNREVGVGNKFAVQTIVDAIVRAGNRPGGESASEILMEEEGRQKSRQRTVEITDGYKSGDTRAIASATSYENMAAIIEAGLIKVPADCASLKVGRQYMIQGNVYSGDPANGAFKADMDRILSKLPFAKGLKNCTF